MKNEKRMSKKIILCCIGAVIIILLASFTSVVGEEQTEYLSNKIDSPLFSIRTRRATNNPNSNIATSKYVGKGKTLALPLPSITDTQSLYLKAIDKISKMDDASFKEFLVIALQKLHDSNKIKEEDLPKIEELFHVLRENPNQIKKYPVDDTERDQLKLWTWGCHTVGCATLEYSPLFCLILIVTLPIWFPILILYNLYLQITSRDYCPTMASFGCP